MRPQIKSGDKVRLRTDGEMGEFAKYMFEELIGKEYVVKTVNEKTGMVSIQENGEFTDMVYSMLLDICNDWNEVEVGDEVEFALKNGSTIIHTILKIKDVSIVTNHGVYWIEHAKECFLRIVKKAEKPQQKFAGIKVGDGV